MSEDTVVQNLTDVSHQCKCFITDHEEYGCHCSGDRIECGNPGCGCHESKSDKWTHGFEEFCGKVVKCF